MRAALKAAGMSSEAMARRLGVTGATVRGWYLERREPDLASLRAFSSAAGCSLLWLLEGDQAPEELGEWALAFADLVAAGVDPSAALTPAELQAIAAQFEAVWEAAGGETRRGLVNACLARIPVEVLPGKPGRAHRRRVLPVEFQPWLAPLLSP